MNDPLPEDEMPEILASKYKLVLVKSYFDKIADGYTFPAIMKQFNSEDDPTYEARVKNYLLCMSDEQFTQVGDLIDPEDIHQAQFFELYTELQSARLNKTEKANCEIF